MKKKPRRNVTSERDEEDNASSCSTPVKDKENFSPRPSLINVKQNRYNILLRDFDDNGKQLKWFNILFSRRNSKNYLCLYIFGCNSFPKHFLFCLQWP